MRNGPFLAIVLAALLVGCAAPRGVVPEPDGTTSSLRIKAGDVIRIVTIDRQRHRIEVTEVRATELVGVTLRPTRTETAPRGQQLVVAYDALAMVEVDRFSKARTSGLIVSLAMVGALVAAPLSVVPAVTP